MFSDPPILNDFVYPIPYCQSETNIGSILNIFQRWNCQQIAIHQNGRWGIIEAIDLLSLFAEGCLKQEIVTYGSFKSSVPQQNIANLSIQNFSLVKPAVVYSADIQLDEFLGCLSEGTLARDRRKYLLLDNTGRLQGKLDKNKILEYLAAEYEQNLAEHSQPLASSNFGFDLLNAIPLPLKVETLLGEQLYSNKCWQELVNSDRSTQQQLQSEGAIASWWIEQQNGKPTSNRSDSPRQATASESETEYLSDRSPSLSSSLASSDYEIDNNSPQPNQQNQSYNSARTQIEIEIDGWNCIKIPLTNVERASENTVENRLVMAISTTSMPSLPRSIADKLLAAIAHELKSPLTGIMGLSSLLEAGELGQLNQRQSHYVELIHSSGQKMMDIVKELIKLTILTEKFGKVETESIDLETMCRQVYQQLDRIPSSDKDNKDNIDSNYQLELDLESETNTAIASPEHLSCILFHLMTIASEFARSPDRLKIAISEDSEAVTIAISSTLTTEARTREPKYSLNSSLRLAIVEYLVELVRGSLKIDRSLESCQFTLLLPSGRAKLTSPPLTASTTQKSTKRNLTILCLDPEAEVSGDRTERYHSLSLDLRNWSDSSKHQTDYQYRILEANELKQAHMLARIWQLDVIVVAAAQIDNPLEYLKLLQTSEYLSTVPIVTLDNETTQAANQIKNLSVYPCLLPAEHRQIEDLIQVIEIAAG